MSDSPTSNHPFIETFREAWRTPTLETLMAPLREDVRLIQPLSNPTSNKNQARKAFRQILFRFPGLRGEISGGLGIANDVLIDWTMIVPIGHRDIRIPMIDKVTLSDGMVLERTAYFDPTPLMGPITRSPRTLGRFFVSAFFK